MGPSKYNVPDEKAEPSTRPQNEDGNSYWDSGRFNRISVFNIYDVPLLRTVNGLSQRIGARKISCYAFLAAKPEEMLVKLT